MGKVASAVAVVNPVAHRTTLHTLVGGPTSQIGRSLTMAIGARSSSAEKDDAHTYTRTSSRNLHTRTHRCSIYLCVYCFVACASVITLYSVAPAFCRYPGCLRGLRLTRIAFL